MLRNLFAVSNPNASDSSYFLESAVEACAKNDVVASSMFFLFLGLATGKLGGALKVSFSYGSKLKKDTIKHQYMYGHRL